MRKRKIFSLFFALVFMFCAAMPSFTAIADDVNENNREDLQNDSVFVVTEFDIPVDEDGLQQPSFIKHVDAEANEEDFGFPAEVNAKIEGSEDWVAIHVEKWISLESSGFLEDNEALYRPVINEDVYAIDSNIRIPYGIVIFDEESDEIVELSGIQKADLNQPEAGLMGTDNGGGEPVRRVPDGAEQKPLYLPDDYFTNGNTGSTVETYNTRVVWLPKNYATDSAAGKKYSTVFLLTGGGGSMSVNVWDWMNQSVSFGDGKTTDGKKLFSNLVRSGRIGPSIFVSCYCDYNSADQTLAHMRNIFANYSTYIDKTNINSISNEALAFRMKEQACAIVLVGYSSGAISAENFMEKYNGAINNYLMFSFGNGSTSRYLSTSDLSAATTKYGKTAHLVVAEGENEIDHQWPNGTMNNTEAHYNALKNYAGDKHYYVFKNGGHDFKTWYSALYISLQWICEPVPLHLSPFQIKKTGSEGANGPSLAKAQFTVKYYTTQSNINWNTTPTKTWVLKTDSNGYAKFQNSYKVSGDAFDTVDGSVVFFEGTLLIKETLAPEGYTINNTLYTLKIQKNSSGNLEIIGNGLSNNVLEVYEEAIKERFKIKKYAETDDENKAESGITFEVYNSSNQKVCDMTTDSNGEATSDYLVYGTYTVKQKNTSYGTQAVPDFQVNIPADKDKTFEKVNPLLRSKILLIKVDKDTEKPIEGAKFVLKNAQGKFYAGQKANGKTNWVTSEADATMLTTNGEGKILVEGLKHGRYYFIEKSVPAPYIVDSTPHEVVLDKSTLDSENKVTLTVDNSQSYAKIRLEKKALVFDHVEEVAVHDDNTGEDLRTMKPVFVMHYLAGATFEIVAAEDILVNGDVIYHNGDVADTLVTNATGPVTSKNLPFGHYVLKETVVPVGYVKMADKPVELKQGQEFQNIVIETVNLENKLQKTSFSLVKLAEEIVVDPSTGEVSIVTNTKEGFVFGVYAKESISAYDGSEALHADDLVAVGKSDASGNIVITGDFPIANYYVQEISAPDDRYILDTTKYDVTNNVQDPSKQVIEVKVTDEPIVNHLDVAHAQIVKVDAETGEIIKIAGFKFEIYDASDNKVDTVVTNAEGIAKLQIPLEHNKTYKVKEVEVPSGFVLNKNLFELKIEDNTLETIGSNEERYTCRFSNTRVKGSISIEKTGLMITGSNIVDKNGFKVTEAVRTVEPLVGAKFRISALEDIKYNGKVMYSAGEEVGILVTKKTPVSLDGLYLGKYKIEEIDSPNGYILVPNTTEVELKASNSNVAVVAKDYSFNNELRGMHVELYKVAEVMGTETDAEGNVTVTYSFAPAKGFTFGLFNAADIVNPNTNKVVIPADSMLDVCVSDEDGKLVFEGQYPVGNYYIKEVAVSDPTFYVIDEQKLSFSNEAMNDDDPGIEVSFADPVKNNYKKMPVVVNKTDITGELGLPGALLEIKDENGTVIYSHVTDESGSLEEISLIPGKYTIHEVYAPEGYALSEDEVEFEIVENEAGELEVIGSTTMIDEPTEFKFYKVDETGKKKLSGAEFTMYKVVVNGDEEELVPFMVAVSDENGIVEFKGFGFGLYVIKETLAPEDYMLTDETIDLEVTREWLNNISYTDGGELMMSIKNNQPPHTGNELSSGAKTAIIIAIATGSALALAAAGYVVFRVIKKKRSAH